MSGARLGCVLVQTRKWLVTLVIIPLLGFAVPTAGFDDSAWRALFDQAQSRFFALKLAHGDLQVLHTLRTCTTIARLGLSGYNNPNLGATIPHKIPLMVYSFLTLHLIKLHR